MNINKPSSKTGVALPALSCLALAGLLTGCGNLQDVKHRWCDPEPVMAKAEPPSVAPLPAPAPVVASARYKIRLQADALFQFNGARMSDLKPAGQQALAKLVSDLKNGYTQVDHILVVGHTDRLGKPAYNQRLSEQRAATVKQYLLDQGVQAPIDARGAGKTEPVTTDCKGIKASPALIQCLQPDRRVEVEVTGMRKDIPAQ